jgi:outer membrane protein TolC
MRVLATVVGALLALPAAGLAQTDAATPLALTLDEAVARGLAASHRVAEVRARGDAMAAVVENRRSALRPQVAALGGYTRTNHVEVFGIQLPNNQLRVIYPDIPDNVRTRLDVQWPVYTGGRLEALTQAAERDATTGEEDVAALRADVTLDVTRAFWGLVVAIDRLRVVDESLARTHAHLEAVRNQLAAGLVAPSDVLNVQAQESRQRMLSIQARSARDVAEADLARLVGVGPGTRIQPQAGLEPSPSDVTFAALVAEALDQRRDRKALVARLSGAESRITAALAGRRPVVALAGGLDYARPNPRIFPRQGAWRESWDAGVNVSWPLFDGGRAKAEAAQASAERRAVQARIDEFDSMLSLEIRQRLSEITASRAAIAAADDGLQAATEARRVVGERFTAGVATSADVLDAQVAVLQAGLDRSEAVANARLAAARLHRAVGR